ncbi:MAG TPA: alkaline phosphatase family protein [Terriglobia bacterium]|nr:alkaline phosphatase family protein [Terriglobia bacterium]
MPTRPLAAVLAVLLSAAATTSCQRTLKADRPGPPQVVILGFDGADPGLLSKWMRAGKLPHLARLAREGAFEPLGTTNPPESPVAWASFATGLNPGGTGIFDFLKRDPKTYLPELALAKSKKPEFLFNLLPIKGPQITNERHGTPFYKVVADAGYKAVVLRMPLEFPSTPLPGGKLWAGLGVPDMRGTWGTFFFFSTDLEPWDAGDTEFGGRLVSLQLKNNMASASIGGPVDPTSKTLRRISVPVQFTVNPVQNSVTIRLDEHTETVAEGHWSGWFRTEFPITPLFSVNAISRFYVVSAFPSLRVYMSPLNIDPVSPALPISYPSEFTAQLAKAHGLFKTLGWWHDTWALNEEKIGEGVFLEDAFHTMQKLSDITLDELQHDNPRLLVSIFTSTDSVSHMFYRLIDRQSPRYDPQLAKEYGDAILQTYERMDRVTGEAEKAMEPGGVLLVVSDHGFHSFDEGFNTNTWLVENGFMKLKNPNLAGEPMSLGDLFGQGSFFPNVDWRHTQAYALGLGQIYLNLRGREKYGIVSRGAAADHVLGEIRAKLLAYRNPKTHRPVLEDVYLGRQIFHGAYLKQAPDLQLDFFPGYRTSWQTSLGAIPPGILVPNTRKWSGDHCSSDPADTPGIFLSNRALRNTRPRILDIAPTVLSLFDLQSPAPLDGHALELADGERSQ